MSMIGNLARISVQQLGRLHQDPASIIPLLYPDEEEPSAPQPSKAVTAEILGESDRMDLDKAWHCLHFLFTGQAWTGNFPNGFLVSCGEPVGDEDVGYGPARSFTPSEVVAIAAFLEAQDEGKLRSSVNWAAMHEAEIYGSAGDENPVTDEEWEYFVGAFRNAREFMIQTAARKMAVLVYLN